MQNRLNFKNWIYTHLYTYGMWYAMDGKDTFIFSARMLLTVSALCIMASRTKHSWLYILKEATGGHIPKRLEKRNVYKICFHFPTTKIFININEDANND